MLYAPDISQKSEFSAASLGWIFESTHPQINKKHFSGFQHGQENSAKFSHK